MTELEKVSAIKMMRGDGVDVEIIAKHFNTTKAYIYSVTYDQNVDRRRKVNKDKEVAMRELFLSGVSLTEISKTLDITYPTLFKYLRDLIEEKNKKMEKIILQGLKDGKRHEVISAEAGCSLATLYKRKKALMSKAEG